MEGFLDFSRKVKLTYFFCNRSSSKKHKQDKMYREKSSWQPDDKMLPPEIIAELEDLRLKLGKIRISSETPNMTQFEYAALKKLSNMCL